MQVLQLGNNVQEYIRRNPIPTTGSWDAISGEEFLRKLLTGGLETATWKGGVQDPLFSHVGTLGVDPRALGQRIMDIRTALATEFIQVRAAGHCGAAPMALARARALRLSCGAHTCYVSCMPAGVHAQILAVHGHVHCSTLPARCLLCTAVHV